MSTQGAHTGDPH